MDGAVTHLPPLRDDIALVPGPMDDHGWPSYTLHDPVRHRFYRLGWSEFEILVRWGGTAKDLLARLAAETTLALGDDHIKGMLAFLARYGLLKTSPDMPVPPEPKTRHWLIWLLHHYLFIRIPLIRPEPWLKRLAPRCGLFYGRSFWMATALAGLVGLFLAMRQWESFHTTFVNFFSLEGLIWYGLALTLAKLLHELGHAVTLRRLGGQVPTMGVAFLVLWPMLYTETSSSWLLKRRRDRLAVGAAGILAELALAAWAMLAWGLLPDSPARMAAYLLATITLAGTLTINASPLMRFDGYYLLSDAFGIANLQERGFAMARWRLRHWLLGTNEPPPENLSRKRETIFLTWAVAAWVYRFFLFFGIALLVYYMAFKALGIILMAVEIGWFIGLPIYREVRTWWESRKNLAWNRRNRLSALLGGAVLLLMLLPWRTSVEAPALLQVSQRLTVHAPHASRVLALHVKEGQDVTPGQLLLELEAPDLAYKRNQAQRAAHEMAWRLERAGTSAGHLEDRRVAQSGLESAMADEVGTEAILAQGKIAAPFAGRIIDLNNTLTPGRWLGSDEPLFLLAGFAGDGIEAMLREIDLGRIASGAEAVFMPDDPSLPHVKAKVEVIDPASQKRLMLPYLASLHGGGVAVDEEPGTGNLIPREPVFRVRLKAIENANLPARAIRGTVRIDADRQSVLISTLRHAIAVVLRESGF
jgi:putative peptide zinc metalloprotease protein